MPAEITATPAGLSPSIPNLLTILTTPLHIFTHVSKQSPYLPVHNPNKAIHALPTPILALLPLPSAGSADNSGMYQQGWGQTWFVNSFEPYQWFQ